MDKAMIFLILLLAGSPHPGKVTSYATSALPICDANHDTWLVFDDTALKFKRCNGSTWSIVDLGGGGGVPAGTIIMITSGSCSTGYTQVTALNGKTLIGTLAANGDVGTTGGNDSITPAGSVATGVFTGTAWTPPVISWPAGVPTFTGTPFSSIINHTHPVTITSTSRVQGGTTAATTGTHIMTSTATGGSARAPTAGDLFTGTTSNPTGGVASITPAGTNAWPAGVPTIGAYTPAGTIGTQAFTGTSFDNRSAYTKVIFCSKD